MTNSIKKITNVLLNDKSEKAKVIKITSNSILVSKANAKYQNFPWQKNINIGDIVLIKNNHLIKIAAVNINREYEV